MFDTEFLDLPPLVKADGTVHLPGSKSISNRVLLLAALAEGRTEIHQLLASDDTAVMLNALKQIGCRIEQTDTGVSVDGLGGRLPPAAAPLRLFLGNAGTAMRPLTAALA
ncbi:MAG: bifunctional 3-phosphoshikimate 1-carboxyvinyltransferase/cytidylate kinase, partial [Polaromonas sp.]|nr:bifunctional 3-phosphoshikimate 1-carboxyvinyltransferase/cytidylate kinase [Polaromonas sp.]